MKEKKSKGKEILIAGGAGFIASFLIEAFLRSGHRIIVLKLSTTKTDRISRYLSKIKVYDSDKTSLKKIFAENEIDIVINMATNFGRGKESTPSQIFQTNVIFASELAQEAIAAGVKYYFNTDSALNPKVNLYALSKKVFKDLLKRYFSPEIKVFNIRLEYVYGRGDDTNKFLPMAIEKLRAGEELAMSGGDQELDFVYAPDVASAFLYLAENLEQFPAKFNDFEVGSGQTISLKKLIQRIKKMINSTSKIIFGAVPYRKNEQMYSKANIKTLCGWKPKYQIADGLIDLLSKKR